MANTRVQQVAPEYYFHYEVGRRLTTADLEKLHELLERAAREAFKLKFAEVEPEFSVDLERGSIKGWIKANYKTVLGIIATTTFVLDRYSGVRDGTIKVYQDVGTALTFVKDRVETLLDGQAGSHRIRTERRIGAVAQLDRVIDEFQSGSIGEREYLEKATAILHRIAADERASEIVPLLREYIDTRYGPDFNWGGLASSLPPNPPLPTRPIAPTPPQIAVAPDNPRDRRRIPPPSKPK